MRHSRSHARGYFVLLLSSLLLSLALVVPVPPRAKAQQGSTRQLSQEGTEKQNGQRVALVIGNSAYTNAPRLKNPVNDATDIADALSRLGFNVDHGVDLNQKQMKFMIREFGKKLKAGGQGLFYFSGHGVQLRGRNYLIPVDADITSEADVEDQGVDANLVLGLMDEANNGLNVVILDACRNNPFARSFRSAGSGLAQVDAPTGTLIAYATAPGRVAQDGVGRNGTYTAELLKQMRVPGLAVEEMFKRVRANVRQQTGGEQVPWEASSLIGDFYFNRAAMASSATSNSTGVTTSTPIVNPAAVEQELWEKIKNSADTEDFRDYLKAYPSGPHAAIARSNLRRLEAIITARTNGKSNADNGSRTASTNVKSDIDKRGGTAGYGSVSGPAKTVTRVAERIVRVTPTTGTLAIVAEPGASIRLEHLTRSGEVADESEDTIPAGERSIILNGLRPGRYRVVAELNGYMTASIETIVTAGRTDEVELKLKQYTYNVTIRLNASSGTLTYAKGSEVPHAVTFQNNLAALSNLTIGDYSIKIIPDDASYKPLETTLKVSGESKEVSFELKKLQ
ncbi:MAG: hypothetical protein QOC96_1436 [Acidobacteriota bacterium]|jgi:hypothetical protein|nr:hypothetical protein [Acidobacteriota bacterium]